MIDIFDIFAFGVFAVLIAAALVVIVGLGMLPGWLAEKRGHPQAAAINVASWLGIATGGILWLLAMIWAFTTPLSGTVASTSKDQTGDTAFAQMQARVETLEAALRELKAQKEAG